MEENIQKEEGINLMDIFRLLLSKIKLLILVVIIGGLLGGAYAYLTTYNVKYYGTKIEFYVNPDNPKDTEEDSQFGVYGAYGVHVMDNMVKLLASESFTEFLILNGKEVPERGNWTRGSTNLSTELNELIDKANGETQTAAEKKENVNNALELWRTTDEYRKLLSSYSGKIKYSYLGEKENREDADSLARSFIYVQISVLNNETLARELRQRVIDIVPSYIEKHMAIPNGYQSTNCQRITRSDEVRQTNAGYTNSQVIKLGILAAFAAAAIACVVLIVIDRSDKRLRDQETITRLFNVPVLGVVPTIEEANENTSKNSTEVK